MASPAAIAGKKPRAMGPPDPFLLRLAGPLYQQALCPLPQRGRFCSHSRTSPSSCPKNGQPKPPKLASWPESEQVGGAMEGAEPLTAGERRPTASRLTAGVNQLPPTCHLPVTPHPPSPPPAPPYIVSPRQRSPCNPPAPRRQGPSKRMRQVARGMARGAMRRARGVRRAIG